MAANYKPEIKWTSNEAIEMMHNNTSKAFKKVADYIEKVEMERQEILQYLIEISEQLAAQAILVSMRDELKFDKPKDE